MNKIILAIFVLLFSMKFAIAAENYQFGKITNITATTEGLMVMLDTALPSNCDGTPHGWMLIEKDHTTIISVVLAAWASQAKNGTIYTLGRKDGIGFCLVTQFDPAN